MITKFFLLPRSRFSSLLINHPCESEASDFIAHRRVANESNLKKIKFLFGAKLFESSLLGMFNHIFDEMRRYATS